MSLTKRVLTIFTIFLSLNCLANSLSLLSLNLHGFHPMGESKRYYEFRDGKKKVAPSHLHYFTKNELVRGHKRRISILSKDLSLLKPDLIFLQEVGAGDTDGDGTNCRDYYNESTKSDWSNSAVQLSTALKKRSQNYHNLLACRGNIGWFTGPSNFKDKRIITIDKDSKEIEIIHDYEEDPYPNGILVEGMAMLISKKFNIIEHKKIDLPYNNFGGKVFIQLIIAEEIDNNLNSYLLLNVHLGHKVGHFEQAVAIRRLITKYKYNNHITNVIIGGDFNARLYRPDSSEISEISTIPFEISQKNRYSFQTDHDNFLKITKKLKKELTILNRDSHYKKWASIPISKGSRQRINRAVNSFSSWQIEELERGIPVKGMSELISKGHCELLEDIPSSCKIKSRIDHFFSLGLTPVSSAIFYHKNSWTALDGPSDHPGIYATVFQTDKHVE